MKKTLRRLLCLTVCVILCLGALTACSSNLEKAKKGPNELIEVLQNEGYHAECMTDSKDIEDMAAPFDVDYTEIYAIVYVANRETEYSAGYFFFFDTLDSAEKNTEILIKYYETVLSNASNFESLIVYRSDRLAYIGYADVWESVASESTNNPWGIDSTAFVFIIIAAVLVCLIVAVIVIVALLILCAAIAAAIGGIIFAIILITVIVTRKKVMKSFLKREKENKKEAAQTDGDTVEYEYAEDDDVEDYLADDEHAVEEPRDEE